MSAKNKSFQLPSSPIHHGNKPVGSGISRNSEMNNPMRRSFTGNPFVKPSIVANSRGFNPNTPANSPSDYALRKSISRESLASLRDCEDKENEKDPNLKPGRVKSPAAPKGTKNFMSPTISAASKIAPSPKKKVLIEKTEPARTSTPSLTSAKSPRSVSFADFVEEIISKPEMDGYKEHRKTDDMAVADMEKEVAEESRLSPESVESETVLDSIISPPSQKDIRPPDTVVLEEDFVDHHASPERSDNPLPASILAPLDADPSMPPYDPRNNYLSPRPQFLHYKPHPRIGHYLKRDGRSVGAGIFSESFSDSENLSEDSQIDSEDASSDEVVEDEEVEFQCSELKPADKVAMHEKTDAKVACKSCFFTRYRLITLLLVGLVACSSFVVNNYPVTQPSAFEDSSLSRIYIPPEIFSFARETIDGFVLKCRYWWQNSIFEVSNLILRFRSAHENGAIFYSNLTLMYDGPSVDDYAGFNHRADTIEPISEDYSSVDAELERGNNDPDYEEQVHQDVVAFDSIDQISEENKIREFEDQLVTGTDLTSNDVPAYDDQLLQPVEAQDSLDEISEGGSGNKESGLQDMIAVSFADSKKPESHIAAQSNSEFYAKEELPDLVIQTEQSIDLLEHAKIQWDSSAQTVSTEVDVLPEDLELKVSNAHLKVLEKQDASHVTLGETFPLQYLLVASFLVMSLAAIAFRFTRKAKTSATGANFAPVVPKKFEISPTDENAYYYQRPSWNQPIEVDIAGGSCPSEMSSFQDNGLSGTGEAQSHGSRRSRKNFMRESLASSDFSIDDSTSFGSFTTYEKIPTKLGEEEVITPVRRSSRIRKQVTSP